VREAIRDGRIEIVMTRVQEDQIAAIPDEGKWGEIVAIPRRVVPTHGVRDLRDRGSAWRTRG
jgi:hypothetical protein